MGNRRTQPDHPRASSSALLGGLALRDLRQGDDARPRPAGRHRARLSGPADPAEAGGRRPRTSTARSRSSASASTRSASPSRRSAASAPTRSRSACPNVSRRRARDRAGRDDGAALLLRLRAERRSRRTRTSRIPSDRPVQPADRRGRGGLQAARGLRRAVRATGLHDRAATPTTCSTPTRCSRSAGPRRCSDDLFVDFDDGAQPENTRVIAVPQGTVVLESSPRRRPGHRGRRRVRPRPRSTSSCRTGRASPATRSPTRSRSTDQTNQPNVTFDFTDYGREAFAEVTAEIAQRGADDASPRPGAPAAGSPQPTPSSSRARSRSSSTASSSRGRSSTSSRTRPGSTAAPAPRSPGVDRPGGAGPRRVPEDRRAADQPEADQPVHGLGDARPAGARPGAQGGADRPRDRPLFLIFYYRFLGVIAGARAGRLRDLLLRPDEADPDHADPAGHRRPGPDDRRRRRLQHRHLRANKGGGAERPLDALGDPEGYRKGIATIIDANVITLLTAFILFGLATAGVKGFAFTLGIGTIVSLFTAVVFTRAVLGVLGRTSSCARRRSSARARSASSGTSTSPAPSVVLLDVGRDPRDRRDRLRDRAAQPRDRLRVRDQDQGRPGRARQRRRGPRRARPTPGSRTPARPRSRRSRTRSSAPTSSRSRRRSRRTR